MANRTGQSLGNYRLVRLLGQGGFAEVYLGEHVHLGTEAALKLLHTQLGPEETDAFRREARTIARLLHPHIVRVLDFGIDGTIPFLVMDYAPRGTVRTLHPKGVALPVSTILTYTQQVASALQYAHDAHLIHRDVKPENLLLGRQEEILLGDFGIALLAQTSRSQSTQDVAGTASYMAPEQLQGKPRPASDQYALGIMVYEWLTGSCPFHGSFTEIASQHLFTPPPPLQGRTPAISTEVAQVVMTALAKDPGARFASVQEFATAFEQALQAGSLKSRLEEQTARPITLAVVEDASVPPLTQVAPGEGPASFAQDTRAISASLAPTLLEPSVPPAQKRELAPTILAAELSPMVVSPPYTPSQMTLPPAPFLAAGRPATSAGKPVRGSTALRFLLIGLAGLVVAVLASGIAWFTLHHATPAGVITEFSLPTSSQSYPEGIAAGPDGNLWFTEQLANKVGRISTSGTITEFPLPTPDNYPFGITAGSDGNLWFTEYTSNKIGRISTSGAITEFPLPTPNNGPGEITTGTDGNLWFIEAHSNKIGRISPSGAITEFPLPTPDGALYGITAGPDGSLWFTEEFGNKIGRISTSGSITGLTVSTSLNAYTITSGPDGNLWFTEQSAHKIGRISPSGAITEFPLPTSPWGITAGPDGNLWFTEQLANKVGRISPSGTITEFPLSTPNNGPVAITAGPDGNLWFTESKSNKIGRISSGR